MNIVELPLAGLRLIKPKVFADDRGFFLETWRRDQLPGIELVQDNHSRSAKNTIRGMHFQRPTARAPGQVKLVRCAKGQIFDVVVDIRPDSPTYGQYHAEVLDDVSHHQLLIPIGFAHGFCVLSDVADVCYRVSAYYDPEAELGFRFDDPDVAIPWPVDVAKAIVSKRDATARPFKELVWP